MDDSFRCPCKIILGDQHGLNTLKYQPTKIAAIEGHWENKGMSGSFGVIRAS